MPASLFEHKPSVCPFGHDLAPGRVSVGFSPCVCALAREAAAHGGSMGHLRLHCLACEGEGRSSIFLEPPCDVRHREQPGGWQLTPDPAVAPPPQAARCRATSPSPRGHRLGSAPGSARVAARLRGAVRERWGSSDAHEAGRDGRDQALGYDALGSESRPFDFQGGVLCHRVGAELRVNPFCR